MTCRILITGGHGFIAKHLSRALITRGFSVIKFGRANGLGYEANAEDELAENINADLGNEILLQKYLDNCEIVFHKASTCPSNLVSNDSQLYKANIEGTKSFLNALNRSNGSVKHVLVDSSISVYGEGCYHCHNCGRVRPPIRTQEFLETRTNYSFELSCPQCLSFVDPIETSEDDLLNGRSAYARSKQEQEHLLKLASEKLGFTLTIFRYATVYGAGQRESNTYGRLLKSISSGSPITLNEDGLQKRDFIHIDDVVEANLRALERKSNKVLTFNIGSGKETTLKDFVNCAINLFSNSSKKKSEIEISQRLAEGDIRHCKINCKKALYELGFKANIDIKQGLSKSIFSLR